MCPSSPRARRAARPIDSFQTPVSSVPGAIRETRGARLSEGIKGAWSIHRRTAYFQGGVLNLMRLKALGQVFDQRMNWDTIITGRLVDLELIDKSLTLKSRQTFGAPPFPYFHG